MANVIGSGSSLFTAWSVAPPVPTLAANLPGSLPEQPRSGLSPETAALFARVAEVLAPHPGGLALTRVREALGAPAQELRVAIEAGIRARSIRRVGAGSTLRYVLNPRG